MSILIAGTIGIVLGALGLWGQIRFIISFPLRAMIIDYRMTNEMAALVLSYLHATCKSKPRHRALHWAGIGYVKPLGKIYRVFHESLHNNSQFYFRKRVPIWFKFRAIQHTQDECIISFFRWTLDWEKLLADVAAWEDELKESGKEHRFRIFHHGGQQHRATKVSDFAKAESAPSESPGNITRSSNLGDRLLHWRREDIGLGESLLLESMSLRPELVDVIKEIKFFLDSKDWFEQRGIPWRRGWLLHGKPGTGKTSFVRGIAAKFDLPVHVFDLSSMSNGLFRLNWANTISDAPCIALIEDIDTVFNGRNNLHSGTLLEGALTYDCLLNCIGGIDISEGVLLFVSSNRPETIDPALLRGGRLDRSVEVLGLDDEGKIKLASRILGDHDEACKLVAKPEFSDMTPAELQETLSKLAILRRFG